jgi:hypothetical protein
VTNDRPPSSAHTGPRIVSGGRAQQEGYGGGAAGGGSWPLTGAATGYALVNGRFYSEGAPPAARSLSNSHRLPPPIVVYG